MSSPWVLEYSPTVINEYPCPKIRCPKIISWEIYRVARFIHHEMILIPSWKWMSISIILMFGHLWFAHATSVSPSARLLVGTASTTAQRCTRHIQGIGVQSGCVYCLQGTFRQTLASACWGWVWSAITTMQRRQAALQKSKNQLHVGEASVIHRGTFSHVPLIENMNLTRKALAVEWFWRVISDCKYDLPDVPAKPYRKGNK